MPRPVERLFVKFLCHIMEAMLSFGQWVLFIANLVTTSVKKGIVQLLPLIVATYRSMMRLRRYGLSQLDNAWENLMNEKRVHPVYGALAIMTILFVGVNLFMPATQYGQAGHSSILYQLLIHQQPMDGDDSIIEDDSIATLDQVESEPLNEEDKQSTSSTLLVDGSSMTRPLILEPVASRKTIQSYTVQDGDTISSIAAKFGLRIETLLWQNKLSAYSVIRPNQTLSILPVDGVAHTVAKGDTMAAIAKRYKTTPEAVLAFNNLPSNASITSGQLLIIPGGSPVTPSTRALASSKTTTSKRLAAMLPSSASISLQNLGSLLWPTLSRHINQYFHWRHTGVDIKGTLGSPVYAVDEGVVEIAGWNSGGYGYQVIINHGNGKLTRYAHLSRFSVARGQAVEKGDTIGLIGSTGRSTGPHLHFEVIANGKRLNPLSFLHK